MSAQYTNTIFLTGFMGCGKSYWGQRWAAVQGCAFTELDAVIEKNAGTSIAQIFETAGETEFRRMEAEALRQSVTATPQIISTGGGTPCFWDNMDWMNAHGTTIYLAATPALLAERLRNETAQRPLVKGLSGDALLDFITQKLAEREPFYRQAAVVLDAATLTAESLRPYLV